LINTLTTIGRNLGFDTRLIGEGMGHESELATAGYFDTFENPVLDKANEMSKKGYFFKLNVINI